MDVIIGRLWMRSVFFRYIVCAGIQSRWPWLTALLWRHTPVGYALRELFLRSGDLANAAACARELRKLGMEV